ncbi:MAG TPA: ribonuclease P protein component [Rhodospirillales bacterium]|nr:ribonuclease P protein component [Rhodospirillales bacterium]
MTSTPSEGIRLEGLRRRAQFLEAARGRKVVTPAFVLQSCGRRENDPVPTIGVGFTATRRLGKAVVRNRARRRLREAARRVLPHWGQPGRNYVLIARQAVLTWPFDKLQDDLRDALRRMAGMSGRRRARPRSCSPS